MATHKCSGPQELRVVLLGGKYSGKTSLINTVLGWPRSGSTKQRSAHSLVKKGEVKGRDVVLVNTHGWWRNSQLIDTAKIIQQELVLSVLLCPPGPHAFILTVMIDIPFDEDNRRAIEQHMGLFGEDIWRYTMIVFTRGDSLEGKTIEQHIESEGDALKWLVEKCGKRYWVYDKNTTDQKQVYALLERIETILEGNSGRHFELDENSLKKTLEKKEDVKKRAENKRLKIVEAYHKEMEKNAEMVYLPEMRILLLGWVSSRKTSAKNIILSQTEKVTNRTTSVQTHSGEVDGVKVSVVDTPGWWKYFPAESTPAWVRRELRRSLSLGSKAPHAILLAIPVDSTFLEEQRKITEDNMKMFGEQVWRHTMVLFTCRDLLGESSVEEYIESEGQPLQWLVEKCGNRYHVFDNINRGDGSQVTELLQKIREMEALNSSPALETEDPDVKESKGVGLGMEMGELLDKEWNRMDQVMEAKVKNLWESAGTAMKGNRSVDAVVDFQRDEPSEKTDGQHGTLSSAFGQAQHQLMGQASEVHSELLEKMRDSLVREFGRRETVVMERALGMVLEMSTSQDLTSEPCVHERDQSRQKVMQWITDKSSGIGSELDSMHLEEED